MAFRGMLVAAVAAGVLGSAPGARAAELPTHAINANINDPGIDTARGQNFIYLAPADKRVGRLLVFIPFGGAQNLPTRFTGIGSEAGRLGYHTIVLPYKNEVPIANASACGNEELPLPTSPQNCAINARMEILDGGGESTVINVDRANSIENRLNKVLAELATNPEYAGEGWAQFLEADGTPKWSETVIAGGSLGAGMAALIAQLHLVHRVALFSGWTDAKHPEVIPGEPPHMWVKIGATPAEKYFSLIHFRDVFYARTCPAYAVFAMAQTCPLTDAAELAENRRPPYGTRQLVFNLDRDPTAPEQQNGSFHPATVNDVFIPKAADGVSPSPLLVDFWRSTLGDSDADSYLDEVDNCVNLANSQIDADDDGAGDACDPTPRGTIAPVITVAPVTTDATGPAGALVNYTATATDDLDGTPPVTCVPAAGQFAIGTTTVACSASDAGGNTANASFTVKVRSAPEQLARLTLKAGGSPQLAALIGSLDPSRPLQHFAACLTLRAFVTLVPFVVPNPQAADWVADANRIRAVLAC